MPKAIPQRKRAAILKDIKAEGAKRNEIARKHGVSAGTVTGIAKAAGLEHPFDRSATKRATEAAVADNAAWRASTSRRFIRKANDLLDQMDCPHLVFAFGGKENTYNEHLLDRPPTGDLRNLMVSAATAFDKHLAAERHDAGDESGLNAVDAWLRGMLSETGG